MNEQYFNSNPRAKKERQNFEEFTRSQAASAAGRTAGTPYIIPVVFHVYLSNYFYNTVIDDQTMIRALEKVNEDFRGLNDDFQTVNPGFQNLKTPMNVVFALAKKDPSGQPTTGIIYHPAKSGYGGITINDQVRADAWDNYKYCNVFIQSDLYGNGNYYNSGVAWYPDSWMSDNKLARIVYNGNYLYGNTSVEFASTLTHEFGHWLNLMHTFQGNCEAGLDCTSTGDLVCDTPIASISDGCSTTSNCLGELPNTENYMGYAGASGCYKMFTAGQVDRMSAALFHPARVTLWQSSNLSATGIVYQEITFSLKQTASYCDADISLTATATSGLPVSYETSDPGVAQIVSGKLQIKGAGTAVITASQTGNSVYTRAIPVKQTITVNKCLITVKPGNISRVYGDADPVPTLTYTGLKAGETPAVIDTPPVLLTATTSLTNVGSYTFTLTGGSDNNYGFNYSTGTLTISRASVAVSADNQSRAYGDPNPILTLSYSGFRNGETAGVLDIQPKAVTSANATSTVGGYPITLTSGSDNNYSLTYTNGLLTIIKATLSVVADNKLKTYGDPNPALTISYSGFRNNETASVLNVLPSLSTNAAATSDAGIYQIIPAGGSDDNYLLNYVSGTFTIAKAQLNVTGESKTMTYGDPAPTFNMTYSGFRNGENESVLDQKPAVVVSALSGNLPVTEDFSGCNLNNYTIRLTDGNPVTGTVQIINPGYSGCGVQLDWPASFSAVNQQFSYGTYEIYARAATVFANQYFGLLQNGMSGPNPVYGVGIGLQPRFTDDEGWGFYVNGVKLGGGNSVPVNYPNWYKIKIRITPDSAKVWLDNVMMVNIGNYGGVTVPSGGWGVGSYSVSQYDNFKYTPFQQLSPANAGTYPVVVAGGSDNNYSINPVNGIFTVNKAELSVTAESKGRSYGDANPAFTISYSGFKFNETPAVLDSPPVPVTIATVTSAVGSYPITLSGGSDNNYAFTKINGTLTISKVPLTATADNKTRPYGNADPVFTVTYSGLKNNETAAVIDFPPTITTNATILSDAGSYLITPADAVDNNYTFSYTKGTLTVAKASLTALADDKIRAYGDANPAFTITYSGFRNNESATVLNTAPTAVSAAMATSPSGTYPITVSGGSDNNYEYVYSIGTLMVSKAALTATADNKTRTYGEPNPAFTITYSGFRNSETVAVIDVQPSLSTTALQTSDAGIYPISVSGGSDNNYTIAGVNGTLTVAKASQAINFGILPDVSESNGSFTVSAVSSSGLSVTFSSNDAGKVSVNGTTVTIAGPGSATIIANQAGSNNYSAAPPVSRTLCILPLAPSISLKDDPELVLNSTANAGNQWYRDGQAISGATGKSFVVIQTGIYSAKLIIDGCAGPLSNTINLIVTGDVGNTYQPDGLSVQIYPNPASNELRYEFAQDPGESALVSLVNGMGQTVSARSAGRTGIINVSDLPNGTYVLRFDGRSIGSIARRFIKQ